MSELREKIIAICSQGTRDCGNTCDTCQPLNDIIAIDQPLQPEADVERVKTILIETFAQRVELGAMCSECCSAQNDNGDKNQVYCEMSDKPLKESDYCPQQLTTIDSVLPKIIQSLRPVASVERMEFGKRIAKVFDKLRDSHCFFYLQQAYPEYADEWEWSDYQKLLDKVLAREIAGKKK